MVELAILSYQKQGKNKLGQVVYDFVEGGKVKGYLDMLSGNETDRATALSTSTHVFLTKEIITVTNKDRLRYGSQVYEVTFVDNPVNMGHHLEIYLKVVS